MTKRKAYGILFVYAFIVMLLCAGSSPVIQYLSPDSSIFYTMGRGANKGVVLYKEIADHKGFYLFLFNWIGAWLTPRNMNGLFAVEILFAWIKLIFLYKTALTFEKNKKRCVLAAMMFMAVSTNFLSWNTGNLGEQFALTFQIIGIYYIVLYLNMNNKEGKICEHNPKWMMIHGFCAGVVLFIQANLIAMWIPFGMVLACMLLKQRYIRNFFINFFYLIYGTGIAIIPVMAYGIWYNCIEDMYYVMFEINFLYSKDGRIGKTVLVYLKDFLLSPSGIIVLLAAAGILIAGNYYKKIYINLLLISMLLFSIVCMSVSLNANPIYYTAYMPFMIPIFIIISKYFKDEWFVYLCIAILAITVIANLQLAKKIFRIGTSSYAYESAYQMEQLITDKTSNVLVLGNSHYYNCTGTLPHIKYFTIFGSSLRYETFPYCIDEQFESLCSGENEYVIIQFLDNGYSFWGDTAMDNEMLICLGEQYDMILEYCDGGIHSALYQKK